MLDLPSEGARAPAGSCRALLSRPFMNTSMIQVPAGCLLFSANGETRMMETMWIDDRIALYQGLDNLDLPITDSIEVGLFLFDGDVAAQQCNDLPIDSDCQSLSGCLLKLGPQLVNARPGANVLIDFLGSNDQCLLEPSGSQLYPPESCDGADNYCDGSIDESIIFDVRSCEEAVTADCARAGLKTCIDGETICSISELLDGCNGVDEDCDGQIDEDAECTACSDAVPCEQGLHCLGGTCVDCIDQTHCTAPEICKSNQCQTCIDDADCGDGLYCAVGMGMPRCGRCSPAQPETCPMGQICDSTTLSCRGCEADADCPPGRVCVGGTCAECDPGPNPRRGCLRGEVCADDRPSGGTVNCRPCNPEASSEVPQYHLLYCAVYLENPAVRDASPMCPFLKTTRTNQPICKRSTAN